MQLKTLTLAVAAALGVAACGGDTSNDEAIVQAVSDIAGAPAGSCATNTLNGFAVCKLTAAAGGAASYKDATLRVPAGALSADAVVVLRDAAGTLPATAANQSAQGAAFTVELRPAGGATPTLSSAATLEMTAGAAPVHPQLGEIARVEGSAWERLPANFYRAADGKVLALTTQTNATYRVTYRSLRTESGPAVARGFTVFMDDTFGNDAFFGGALGLHEVLNNVDPVTAVGLGAQVDLAKVPAPIVAAMLDNSPAGLDAKMAALASPATTRALIKAGAVVGVKGIYADPASDVMTSVGITCALCHQNVTPTTFTLKDAGGNPVQVALPIGALSVDGIPNNKMDAGKILSFTPGATSLGLSATLAGWGPNRFDVRALNAFDDGVDNPTDTPPIWNFTDLEAQGYPFGWDGLFAGQNALASQAEAVFHIVMGGKGAFGTANGAIAPALNANVPVRPGVLAALPGAAAPANEIQITRDKLLDLQAWMRSIASPAPGAFDAAKAEAGWRLFNGKGACSTCHTTPELSGTSSGPFIPNITAQPASGDLAHGIRVPSLRGVSKSAPYFHDDSAATLADAVGRVAAVLASLNVVTLTAQEQEQLVEYLKSL